MCQCKGIVSLVMPCFSYFLMKTSSDPSLEVSQQDGSMMGSNICLKGLIWKIIPKLSLLSIALHGGDSIFVEKS